MSRKLTENLIQSRRGYAKLRVDAGRVSLRRAAGERADAGTSGLGRSELEGWTTEDLRRAATTVGTPGADVMRRDELIEVLLSAELASVRGRASRRADRR